MVLKIPIQITKSVSTGTISNKTYFWCLYDGSTDMFLRQSGSLSTATNISSKVYRVTIQIPKNYVVVDVITTELIYSDDLTDVSLFTDTGAMNVTSYVNGGASSSFPPTVSSSYTGTDDSLSSVSINVYPCCYVQQTSSFTSLTITSADTITIGGYAYLLALNVNDPIEIS